MENRPIRAVRMLLPGDMPLGKMICNCLISFRNAMSFQRDPDTDRSRISSGDKSQNSERSGIAACRPKLAFHAAGLFAWCMPLSCELLSDEQVIIDDLHILQPARGGLAG